MRIMAQLLTIDVLGWNGAMHLEETARALAEVPQSIAHIRYIDNASSDNSLEIIKKHLPDTDIVRLEKNIGFAAAHNIGIATCETPFILTLDQDITIIWSGIQKLLDEMQSNPKLGAVQGKLWRKVSAEGEDEGKYIATNAPHPSPLPERERGARIIDSAGIIQTLALNGKERGANEKDTGQYNEQKELLAVTGGCGLYRITALKDIAYPHNNADSPHPSPLPELGEGNEVFDEQFFAYKEDVDLGWRLNKAGWQVEYIPVAVGYHARTMGKRGIFNWGLNPAIIADRLSNQRTRYSLRNYIWMLAKNMTLKDILLNGTFIIIRLFIFFILSLFSSELFNVWKETFKQMPTMMGKRK